LSAHFGFLAATAVIASVQAVTGAQVVRGPYLQIKTPTSVIVRWRTDAPTDSRVQFGRVATNLNQAIQMSGARTNHEVNVTGLLPYTAYFYSVGSSTGVLASGGDYRFVTAPMDSKPIRIWAIGDSGTGDGGPASVRDAYTNYTGSRYTDVWLMLGDNAYNASTDAQFDRAVFGMFPELFRQTALWPERGNDDSFLGYDDAFTLPRNGEAGGVPSGNEYYFSFNYGNIHFVGLDSTGDVSTNGAMYHWMEQDLKANSNQWLIAYWHHPPYSDGSHKSDLDPTQIALRQNFVPLLEAHGVDLVLCGHSHSYERSYWLHGHYGFSTNLQPSMILNNGSGRENQGGAYIKRRDGPLANKGTVYVVAGNAGRPIAPPDSLPHPAMFFSLLDYGSVVIDVYGNRLDARELGSDGVVRDYFTIIKEAPPALAIDKDGTNILLSWPAHQTNFTLHSATNLTPPISWQALTNTATNSIGQRTIHVPGADPKRFFRLEGTLP
jgi:calcineurin-like phosphoesterase family protein/purple acid phosphatase-like protein